jgi:hypothetical protein
MGYFDMIDQSDIFIIADNAQFVRSSWQMRNRIKVPTGFSWLIVPVKRDPIVTPINKVRISYDRADPLKKHWETISVFYKKSKFLNDYANKFHTIFTKNYVYLKDLNVDLNIGYKE